MSMKEMHTYESIRELAILFYIVSENHFKIQLFQDKFASGLYIRSVPSRLLYGYKQTANPLLVFDPMLTIDFVIPFPIFLHTCIHL